MHGHTVEFRCSWRSPVLFQTQSGPRREELRLCAAADDSDTCFFFFLLLSIIPAPCWAKGHSQYHGDEKRVTGKLVCGPVRRWEKEMSHIFRNVNEINGANKGWGIIWWEVRGFHQPPSFRTTVAVAAGWHQTSLCPVTPSGFFFFFSSEVLGDSSAGFGGSRRDEPRSSWNHLG